MEILSLSVQTKRNLIFTVKKTIIDFLLFLVFQNPIPKIQYYIDHRNQREAQILDVVESNPDTWYTDMNLVKVIYIETPEQLWRAAAHNVKQHLKKLEKDHKVESKLTDPFDKQSQLTWKFLKK